MYNYFKKLVALSGLFILLLPACKTKTAPLQAVKPVTKKGNITAPAPSSIFYVINSATVKDSILSIDITYTQPCGNYSFDLVADGKMAKSIPPQISTYLIQNMEKQGGCKNKKKKTEVLQFNINPLRVNGLNKVMVNLNDSKLVEFNYFPFISID